VIHHHARGAGHGHIGRRRLVIWFVGGFVGLTALGALIGALRGSPEPKSHCRKNQPVCVKPPGPEGRAPRLVTETEYRDPQGRFRFEYPSNVLAVSQVSNGVNIKFTPSYDSGNFGMSFVVADASTSPTDLVQKRLAALSSQVVGLQKTSDPAQVLLGPELGFRAGTGGHYEGSIRSGGRVTARVQLIVVAATDGNSTVAMTVAESSTHQQEIDQDFGQTDHLLNSFRFASDFNASTPGGFG
jgi:hypothetical protein